MVKNTKRFNKLGVCVLGLSFIMATLGTISIIRYNTTTGFSKTDICHSEEEFSLAEQTICNLVATQVDLTNSETAKNNAIILFSACSVLLVLGLAEIRKS